MNSKTIVETDSRSVIDNAKLAKTPDDAVKAFTQLGFDVFDKEADGILSLEIWDDKSKLISVPFLILEWRFNTGDIGDFVSVEFMLQDGTKGVFNDGSTGILRQLQQLTLVRTESNHPSPTAGRFVSKGLRVSRYQAEMQDGSMRAAETYYLAY